MLRTAVFGSNLARVVRALSVVGALSVSTAGCSSDPPASGGAGGSGGLGGALPPTAGAGRGGTSSVAGSVSFGGNPQAGTSNGGSGPIGGSAPVGGSAPLGGMAGTFSIGGGQAGAPPNTGGQPNGGTSAGGTSGGGAAGVGGMGGSGGMKIVNPPGTCNTTYDGFKNYQGNGSITFYTFQMGTMNNIHCSYGITQRNPDTVAHTYTTTGRYFAAMNTADYRASAACGACVEVSGSDGRKVTVTVVDECPIGTNPKCTAGHLDLSREAFRQLANESEGHVGTGHGGCCRQISWKYVPCPVPENQNVTFRLKEPTNQYYTTVIVQDHKFPIKSLQIKGMEATRQPDNFWIVGDGNLSPGPWPVRAVDVNNWVYEATLELGQSNDVSSGSRAVCQ